MDKITPEIEKNDQNRPCDRGASNEGDRHGDNEVTGDLISEMESENCQRTQVFLCVMDGMEVPQPLNLVSQPMACVKHQIAYKERT